MEAQPGVEDYQAALEAVARPLESPADLEPLIDQARQARVVLLGESTHGTSEYYDWRGKISQRLIETGRFRFIAVEGDWPALYLLNAYVKDLPGAPADPEEILKGFNRWPEWMWGNQEVLELVRWLREWNDPLPQEEKVGFYGMDVYGFWEAMDEVKNHFREVAPEDLDTVRELYEPLAQHRPDQHAYARDAWFDSAEEKVARVVEKLRERHAASGDKAEFIAKQHARAVQGAEAHLRLMPDPGAGSWNARARHMHETVLRLMDWKDSESGAIVWAHNTHIGDARATSMAERRQVNIGQLMREELGGDQTYAVGFACYQGRVLAGREWGAPMETMDIPASPSGTLEAVLHDLGAPALFLLFDDAAPVLREIIGHRAIGVVYRPEQDARGNYVPTRLAERYDALIFFDETAPLTPVR